MIFFKANRKKRLLIINAENIITTPKIFIFLKEKKKEKKDYALKSLKKRINSSV